MNTCVICGARLSDNNIEGIGYECKAALNYAKVMVLNQNDDYRLNNYLIEVKIYKEAFIEEFQATKFRSAFRKSFYESIKNGERVSRKQLDIMKSMLEEKDIMPELYQKTVKEQQEYKEYMLSEIKVTREMIEIARKIIKGKRKH